MITKYPFQTFIEVSAISIIQSMPGARGRPKRPTWSHFQTIEGGLWVHAMFYHYSQFVQVIFQCQKFLFYESIIWNRIQEYISKRVKFWPLHFQFYDGHSLLLSYCSLTLTVDRLGPGLKVKMFFSSDLLNLLQWFSGSLHNVVKWSKNYCWPTFALKATCE